MTTVVESGKRGRKTLLAALFISAIWLAGGAVSAFANAENPANAPSQTAGIAIVEAERIGDSGAYVRGHLSAQVGETVDYKIAVTNEGNTALTVTLSDPECDVETLAPTGTPTLAAGGTEAFYCTHLLAKTEVGNFVNIATATGQTVSAMDGPVSSGVVAKVAGGGVLGAHKVVVHLSNKVTRLTSW
jgi:hypothetical protein